MAALRHDEGPGFPRFRLSSAVGGTRRISNLPLGDRPEQEGKAMTDQHPDIPRQEPAKPHQPWHRRFGLGASGFEATKRAVFLGLLMLVLLIPLSMIEDLVTERENRKLEVDSEITS